MTLTDLHKFGSLQNRRWLLCSSSEVQYLLPTVRFQITAVYQLRPRLLRVKVLDGSRPQFSGIPVVYQATEEEPNGSSVESGQGTLVRCLSAALHGGSS